MPEHTIYVLNINTNIITFIVTVQLKLVKGSKKIKKIIFARDLCVKTNELLLSFVRETFEPLTIPTIVGML